MDPITCGTPIRGSLHIYFLLAANDSADDSARRWQFQEKTPASELKFFFDGKLQIHSSIEYWVLHTNGGTATSIPFNFQLRWRINQFPTGLIRNQSTPFQKSILSQPRVSLCLSKSFLIQFLFECFKLMYAW